MVTPTDGRLDSNSSIFTGSSALPAGQISISDEFSITHTSINTLSKTLYAGYSADALFNSTFWQANAQASLAFAATVNVLQFLFTLNTQIYNDTVAAQNTFSGNVSTLNGPNGSTNTSNITGFNAKISSLNNANPNFQALYNTYAQKAQTLILGNFSGQAAENAAITAYNNAANAYNTAVSTYNSANTSITATINTYSGSSQLGAYNGQVAIINALVAENNAIGLSQDPTLPNGGSITSPGSIPPPPNLNIQQNSSSPYVKGNYSGLFIPSFIFLPTLSQVPTVSNPYSLPSSPTQYFTFFTFLFLPFIEASILQGGFFKGDISKEIEKLVTSVKKGVVNPDAFNAVLQSLGVNSGAAGGGGPSAGTGADNLNNPNLIRDLSLSSFSNALLNTPITAQAVQSIEQTDVRAQLTVPLVIFGILLLGKSAQVATYTAAEKTGGKALSQTAPNAHVADLLFSSSLAGTLSGLIGSSSASQGISDFLDSISQLFAPSPAPAASPQSAGVSAAPQSASAEATPVTGAAATQLSSKFSFLLVSLAFAKVESVIKNPELTTKSLSIANAIATKQPLPTIFNRLIDNNLKALLQGGPIQKQFLASVIKTLTKAGINPSQAAALANRLTTQKITSVAQLKYLLSAALRASGVATNGKNIEAVAQSLSKFYGLSALHQSVSAVNANAASALTGKYQSPEEFLSALKAKYGSELAQQIAEQSTVAFSGNVLGLEFTPSVEASFANAYTGSAQVVPTTPTAVSTPAPTAVAAVTSPPTAAASPEAAATETAGKRSTLVNDFLAREGLKSTLVNDFLTNVFGFVPGQVPSTTSLFHEQIRILQTNYAQKTTAQTKFEDYVTSVHESKKVVTSVNTFITDKVMNPGNFMSLWSDFYPKHTPAFQERPLEFQA